MIEENSLLSYGKIIGQNYPFVSLLGKEKHYG